MHANNQEKLFVRKLLRVSSNQQLDADGDLPTQRKIVDDYIEKQDNWVLDIRKPEYYEGGVSGFKNSVADREVLQQIMRDAELGEFQVLVCYKDDRLGRLEDEIPQYIKKLAQNGVLVYTVKDGCITPQNHVENLLNFIRYWHAEGSSIDTGQRVKDAAIENVKKGRNQGGSAPFGYKLEFSGELNKHQRALKKKVIVPEQAELVRYMYKLAKNSNYGSFKIAKILNEDDEMRKMSPNGKIWKSETVRDILRNPIYTGYLAYNRRIRKGKQHLTLDREDWVLSDECNEELRIIDMETWEKVQQRREQRKDVYYNKKERDPRTPVSTTGTLALIDVAYCSCCGRKMTNGSKYNYWITKAGEKRSSIVGYYRCQTKQQAETCSSRKVTYRADNIEPKVFEFVKSYLSTLEDKMTIARKLIETSKEQGEIKEKKVRKIEKDIKEIESDIAVLEENLPKALKGEFPMPFEELCKLVEKNKKKKAKLEEEVEQLKKTITDEQMAEIEVDAFISKIPSWKKVFDEGTVAEKRGIINRLIERIEVKDEQISIQVKINLDEFLPRKTPNTRCLDTTPCKHDSA